MLSWKVSRRDCCASGCVRYAGQGRCASCGSEALRLRRHQLAAMLPSAGALTQAPLRGAFTQSISPRCLRVAMLRLLLYSHCSSMNMSMPTACPAGRYNPSAGSISASDCLSCPPGSYNLFTGGNSSSSCTACPAGTYNPSTGSNSTSSCITCPSVNFTVESTINKRGSSITTVGDAWSCATPNCSMCQFSSQSYVYYAAIEVFPSYDLPPPPLWSSHGKSAIAGATFSFSSPASLRFSAEFDYSRGYYRLDCSYLLSPQCVGGGLACPVGSTCAGGSPATCPAGSFCNGSAAGGESCPVGR